MPSFAPFVRWCGLVLLGLSLVRVLSAQLPEKTFTDTLSNENRKAIGLEKLSAEQMAALNQQIARELSLARQGNVKGFAKTFTQRRPPGEREAAGLDKLSDEQCTKLDRSIAWAMAVPIYYPGVKPRFSRDEMIEIVKPKPQINGEVSVMVGAGSGGRSIYGGSMAMTYKDPERKITTTVRYSEYHGDGWLLDDLYYGYPYGYEFTGRQRSIAVGVEFGK